MEILERMTKLGFEEVLMCTDAAVGLKAIIAIHDTTLGPASGGMRIRKYSSEAEALDDVIKLAQTMTYKSAAADLPLGGGKAVITADPHTEKTEALIRSFGRFVNTLGGRFWTATDMGSTSQDVEYLSRETEYLSGLPVYQGGGGDTANMTGLGVYMGMKACALKMWGSDSLRGKKVALQGFGKVAKHTALHLLEEEVDIVACDVNEAALATARDLGVRLVFPEDIYDEACDIFSPSAMGGVINTDTVPRLRCSIVAGGANNQLATPEDGVELARRGILYAPDFIINAGGVINVAVEMVKPYSIAIARQKTERIYDTLLRVFERAQASEITNEESAILMAKDRLAAIKAMKKIERFSSTATV